MLQFFQNIHSIQAMIRSFFEDFNENMTKARENSVTPEFLKIFGIFFENPGQWFSPFDIVGKTNYNWALVYPILLWLESAGKINSVMLGIARYEFTLAKPDQNQKHSEASDANTESAP